jgi:short subunit dehydrogenase-like uncharacterized protein
MGGDVWVLGATGRTGRAIAARLAAAGLRPVLVGRDRARLDTVAAELDGDAGTVVGSLDSVLECLAAAAPAVVVNTIGPFTDTAPRVVRACPPGVHYLDLTNELPSVTAVIDLHDEAVATDRTLVAGAGFGVLGTESVVLRLCAGEPTPARVRVDAMASVATEPGALGTALAASILGGVAAGGRRVVDGRLVRAPLAAEPEALTTPDGDAVRTASAPTGELIAAWRASGAASVVAASSEIPASRPVRVVLPAAAFLLRRPPIARFAVGRLAGVQLPERPRPRESSWAHARVEWASGEVRDGWLRAPEGMDFTTAIAAEVARRLAAGEGKPGAYTPGALFGPALAEAAGGEFVD